MGKRTLSLIGLTIVFIPSALLFFGFLNVYFHIVIFNFIVSGIASWPLYAKLIFYNIVFFLLPVMSFAISSLKFRNNKILNIINIILSLALSGLSKSQSGKK
ncbi:hypothetical protein HY212_03945 [Candidatus Pacearchaeota archaeon]|nr:hypothetical protein [Candidatus Pacearchaeota archaeon]